MENESVIIIPQDFVRSFIEVLQSGILVTDIEDDLREQLEEWIEEESNRFDLNMEWTDDRVIRFVNWYLNSIGFDDGRMWIKGGADSLIEKFKEDEK